MEIFLALVIIIVLCKVLGVSNEILAMGGLGLIVLCIVAMTMLFAYCCVRMLFTKRKEATFTRIDKAPKGNFKVAYYMVDGEEYPCLFPSEMILNDKMYRTDRTYHVMFSKGAKKVYDIYTVITCILGLIFSGVSVYLILQIILMLETI